MIVIGLFLLTPEVAVTAESVTDRLNRLRGLMRREGVAACIVTNSDPHHSEYSGLHWLAREYVSGFTGSAGEVVVLAEDGGLWTDGRYFIQANEQLEGTGLKLFRQRIEGTPSIAEHLVAKLHKGDRVAVRGDSISAAFYNELIAALKPANITLSTDIDLIDQIWSERPQRSQASIIDYPVEFSGQSVADKLQDLREEFANNNIQQLLLSSLPDVAWTLNIRGGDVPYCPLVESFLLVSRDSATLFVDQAKLSKGLVQRLSSDGVDCADYTSVIEAAKKCTGRTSLCPQSTNSDVYQAVQENSEVVLEAPPTEARKACKNSTEQRVFREALRHDGVAMTRFARWLETNVPQGSVTEMAAEKVLCGFRAELPNFLEESFHTIAGYGAHAALMHYSSTEESDTLVGDDALFLVDSGGQYLGGTTDVTRTFAFGELSQLQRMDYTRVLKAVIRLSETQFRKGARGCNLDVMARGVLWQFGIDYECGTGHGVGQCLVVHEGPQGLSQRLTDEPFRPGMSITNEPGIYREGKHGVRIENIMQVVPAQETEFGVFYKFETLTLAPIQTRPLIVSELTTGEKDWLNTYHLRVYEELEPLLEVADRDWLREACEPI